MRGMLMPRAASLGAVAIPLAIYLASAYRDVMYWDIGEMDTVPYILGIAHPPGYPLYTLIGWVFTHVLPLGSVAFRMSALSALALAATCWFVWRIVVDGGGDALGGLGAALLFAFGEDTWAHATRAEPHALVALAAVALLCFLLRWLAHAARCARGSGGASTPNRCTRAAPRGGYRGCGRRRVVLLSSAT